MNNCNHNYIKFRDKYLIIFIKLVLVVKKINFIKLMNFDCSKIKPMSLNIIIKEIMYQLVY